MMLAGARLTVTQARRKHPHCLLIACLLTLAAVAQGAEPVPFRNSRCGITFSHPSTWLLTVSHPKGSLCELTLDPPVDRDVVAASPGSGKPCHLGKIRIRVVASSLEKLAEESDFSRVDGVWHYRAGTVFDNGRADVIAGSGWTGVMGASSSHYCGAAQMTYDIVAGHSTRAVSIGVHADNLDVVQELLRTLTVQP